MKKLWTDGSASPNPGPGGFAVICDGKPVRLGEKIIQQTLGWRGQRCEQACCF